MLNSSPNTSYLDYLPLDVLHLIFEYLPHFILSVRKSRNNPLISTITDKRLIKPDFIKHLIQQLFPYLEKNKPVIFRKDPLTLLAAEYEKRQFNERIQLELTEEEWLHLIRGNYQFAQKRSNAQALYALAFACGHDGALAYLCDDNLIDCFKQCAIIGNTEAASELLKLKKSAINVQTAGASLILACEHANAEFVKFILQEMSFHISREDLDQALYTASKEGRTECLEVLIALRKKSFSSAYQNYALIAATSNYHLKATTLLLKHFGKNINAKYKASAVKSLAANGKWTLMEIILKKRGNPLRLQDLKATCNIAIRHNQTKVLENLLKLYRKKLAIASILAPLLSETASSGQILVFKKILNTPYCTFTAEHLGAALRQAAFNGHLSMVKALYFKNKKRISNKDKGLALINAATYGHLDFVKYLANTGGKNIPDQDIDDALINAAHENHPEVVSYLLATFARRISQDALSDALIYAGDMGCLECAQLILACSDDFSENDLDFSFDKAMQYEHFLVAKLITEKKQQLYSQKEIFHLLPATTFLLSFSAQNIPRRCSLEELPSITEMRPKMIVK